MTLPTLGFTDPALRTLHSSMVATGTVTSSGMDRSIPSIDYASHHSRPVGSPDRIVQSHELFQALISRPNLASLYRSYAGVNLPWIPDGSTETQNALSEFDTMVAEWRGEHAEAGTQSEALARQIFSWLTDPDGFGMVQDASARERSFNSLVRNRRGDCTEFLYAMMVFYRRAGFTVQPVWVGVDMDGHSNIHVCAQISAGGRSILVDPIFQFDAPHRSTAVLSDRELVAWYWNNRGIDRQSHGQSGAWSLYERARLIDPFNPHLWVNRADYQYAQHDRVQARAQITQALRLARDFSPAHERLGNWAFDDGHYSQAAGHYRHALRGDADNWVARDNLIRCLVEMREGGEARTQLAELRRRAPQYPRLRELEALVRSCPP